jgi:hypothetical protein
MNQDQDPSSNQTPDEIGQYYSNAQVGDAACIRSTYGGTLDFRMSIVEKAPAKSRIALKHSADYGGYGFYVDGRNCKSPGGQARLVKPTPEIVEWIKQHPRGSWSWR